MTDDRQQSLREMAEQAAREIADETCLHTRHRDAACGTCIANAIERVAVEFAWRALRRAFHMDEAIANARSGKVAALIANDITVAIAAARGDSNGK